MRRSRIVLLVFSTLAVAGVGHLASSDRYAALRADARAALSWEDLFCSRGAAFRGLVRARMVKTRTAEILRDSRLVRKDEKDLYLWSTPKGEFWMPQENDQWSLAVVLAEQEQEMYGAAGGLGVRAGDIVIDGGAHVGLFTRTALAAGATRVVTFEVSPKSVECLRRNLAKEIDEGKVVVLDVGVWHEQATLPFVIFEKCSVCNRVTDQLPATMDVPLTTIDKAVDDLQLERVDFIKLDIENAEANALRGARATLAKYHPRVAVALENAEDRVAYAREVMDIMKEASARYRYECGACTNPEKHSRILPEILHFYYR